MTVCKKSLAALTMVTALVFGTGAACKNAPTATQVETVALEGADLACAVDQLIQGVSAPAVINTACGFTDAQKAAAVNSLVNLVMARRAARAKVGQ